MAEEQLLHNWTRIASFEDGQDRIDQCGRCLLVRWQHDGLDRVMQPTTYHRNNCTFVEPECMRVDRMLQRLQELAAAPTSDAAVEARARDFANKAHGAQRYGEHPYVVHLSAVVQVLYDFGYFGELAVAGWLHDVLEDTPTKYEELEAEFGQAVAGLVWSVTGVGKNRKARNEDAYTKILRHPRATLLKLADRIANVEASQASRPDLLAMYAREWEDFSFMLKGLGDESMWRRLRRALLPDETP